ncbi:MAG TPA: DUF4234 domain-containing protein [Sandaracinaceae bacterium LLY-WYZ-13_1]|nr:DUF4234 domain-containing protein [Sandaracinaceae bacterium LLY-WYZ-13_1]
MKGEVRKPMTVWILAICTCNMYALYWWYLVGNELKNYLGNEELNPTMDVIIGWVCPFYMYYLPIKYGKLIQEAQQRAGMPNAEDQGMSFLLWMFLCGLGIKNMQEEINKIWESGGGAPATF